MTKEAINAIREKKKAYRKFINSKHPEDRIRSKRAGNKAKKETRKAIKNFEKLLSREVKENPKAFYSYASAKQLLHQCLHQKRCR